MTGASTREDGSSFLGRFRQPEYTGENRCIPCTAVNLAIALVAGAGLAGLALASGARPPSAVAGGTAVVLVAAGVIYLRGYLVPYTPTLTKRYFPDRVLRWFDKTPGTDAPEVDEDGLVDIEKTLEELGVVAECPDVDDLCLEGWFREAWYDRIQEVSERSPGEAAVAELLGLDDPSRVDVRQYGNAAVVAVDGYQAGQWESDAAFTADIAADRVLRSEFDEWTEIDVLNRSRVLNALRMFMERCPDCGQPVTVGQEVVESCCRTVDVAAVSCDACGSRVFEIELTDEIRASA